MLALSDAISRGIVPNAELVLVVSDRSDARGLTLAQEKNIQTLAIDRAGKTREEHEAEVISALRKYEVDVICLAGYMRLLSPGFIEGFPRRILNIHPSLLPSFPGLDVQQKAINHGVKWSGCTVHFVDDTLDGGPIVAQRVVPVLDDDTEATLAERILEQEHLLYPEALALVISGKFEIVGRRVVAAGKS